MADDTNNLDFPSAAEVLSDKSPVDECPVCDTTTDYFEYRFKDGGRWEFWKCPRGHGKWQLKKGEPELKAWWKENLDQSKGGE